MIKGESKNREKWKIGIINKLFHSKDDQMWGARVKAPRNYLDRPIQLLYPLELHCNKYKTKTKQYESDEKKLNIEARRISSKENSRSYGIGKDQGYSGARRFR